MVVNSLTDNSDYIQQRLIEAAQNARANQGANANANASASEKVSNQEVIIPAEGKDEVTLSTKETCTDGKDDGKIGFVEGAKYVAKGAVDSATDMIKGCFTDDEGNFSVAKTLLTAATVGACLLFPPAGIAMCAIGTGAGVYQLGKGAYNVYNAKTDAEAKNAFKDIGGGTLTAGLSAVGVKGSYGAMKSASTANAAKNGSALSEADGVFDTVSAFAKDAWSSSRNNAIKAKDTFIEKKNNFFENRKVDEEADTYINFKKAHDEAAAKQAKGEQLTPDEEQTMKNFEKFDISTLSDEVQAKIGKNLAEETLSADLKLAKEVQEINKMRKANDEALAKPEAQRTEQDKKAIEAWDKLDEKGFSDEAVSVVGEQMNKEALDPELIKIRAAQDEEAVTNIQNALNQYSTLHKIGSAITEPFSNSKTANAIGQFTDGIGNAQGAMAKIKAFKNNVLTGANYKNLYQGLKGDASAIIDALTNESSESVVKQYGYKNVLAAINAAAGTRMGMETI